MEIWKFRVTGELDVTDFPTRCSKRARYCFKKGLPSLGDLLLGELERKDGERWIVFTKKERRKISKDAASYLGTEEQRPSCAFLDRVLDDLRRAYGKRFSVTYLTKNRSNILSTKKEDRHLAIHIEQ